MIVVYKNNKLKFKNKIFKCSLGINGLSEHKKEGDGCTPTGDFSLGKIYYRNDRIKNLKSKKKLISIKKDMFWSDDPKCNNYNKLSYKKIGSFEKLYRKDNIYNIFIVINFNINPIVKGRGSAIFLHLKKKNYLPTKGCVALREEDLIEIVEKITPKERIKIISEAYISA